MAMDLHLARRLVAWGLGIAAWTPILLCLQPQAEHREQTAVTGRVTYSGHPIKNMCLCLDSVNGHSALAPLHDDGSFRVESFGFGEGGATPGRYRAHLYPFRNAPVIPAKYQDSGTSGLEMDIDSDWNYLSIDLH